LYTRLSRARLIVALASCALIVASMGVLADRAAASGPPAADLDCGLNSRLTHHYTVAQLQSALAHMPVDMKEYSACPNVIERALLIQVGRLKLKPGGASPASEASLVPVWLIVSGGLMVAVGGSGALVALHRKRNQGSDPPDPVSPG
jgi:hypothetical protein